jgi:hypothetical protein
MAGSETSSKVLNTIYQPSAQVTLYENNKLFKLFPPVSDGIGTDGNYRFKVRTTGTLYGEASTEGASLPSSNIAKEIGLYHPYVAYQAVAQLTHEAQMYNSRAFGDPMANEVMLAAKNIRDVACDALVTELEAAVGTGATLYGTTRSSYTDWSTPGTDTSSVAISETLLDAAMLNLIDAAKGVSYDELIILASPTLVTAMNARFNKPLGAHRIITRAQGDAVDGGFGRVDESSYNGVPIYSVDRMTATSLIIAPRWAIKIHDCGPINVFDVAKVSRSDTKALEYYCCLTVEVPTWCYLMTNKS